jgi:polyphosphate kinase
VARDAARPLSVRLERLGAVSTALDARFRAVGRPPSGVRAELHHLVEVQYRCWRETLSPALARAGCAFAPIDALRAGASDAADTVAAWLRAEVWPALTPLAVDPGHPFPQLRDGALGVALLLHSGRARGRRRGGAPLLALVPLPSALPRVVDLPGAGPVLLCEAVRAQAPALFPGHAVQHTALVRVTRAVGVSDVARAGFSTAPAPRGGCGERGPVVRLEVVADAGEELVAPLVSALALHAGDVYRVPGPLRLQDLALLVAPDTAAFRDGAAARVAPALVAG